MDLTSAVTRECASNAIMGKAFDELIGLYICDPYRQCVNEKARVCMSRVSLSNISVRLPRDIHDQVD